MKIKHRALALFLSAIMVLAYMPALVFAEDGEPTVPRYWDLTNDDEVILPPGGASELTLTIDVDQTEYTDEQLGGLRFEYRWVTLIDDGSEEGAESDTLGTGETLTVSEAGTYKCYVTDSFGNEYWTYFNVYEPEVIGISFTPVDSGIREVWSSDPFRNGDKLTLRYEDFDDEVIYEYKAGKWLNNGKEISCPVDANYEEAGGGELDIYDDNNIGNNFIYTVRYNYDESLTDGPFDAKCVSGVESMSFSPSTINVWGPDIISSDGTWYDIYSRHTWTFLGGSRDTWYAPGDSLTIKYIDGSTVTYKATLYEGEDDYWAGFYNGDECLPSFAELEWYLDNGFQPGNNKAFITYRGVSTPVVIFIDTPEQKAQRDKAAADKAAADKAAADAKAKEAARQGTPDSKIAKVKISKPAAAKKAVTAKWKKLSSKQIKKGKVKKYEIWVCPNKAFGPTDTIMKEVGKSKSSGKVKVPKKGTYYVKVRAIKKVGGVKYVGKWSSPKKVKVKK